MTKKAIRLQMKEKLSGLSTEQYEQMSLNIGNKLYEQPEWHEASIVGITISRLQEVDTYQIIRTAWKQNKTVVVPKCESEQRQMTFRVLHSFEQLESVYFGLYEPIEAETTAVLKDDIDLLIVPGVAYSEKGYRVGFGGGFYDRFLKDYNGKTVSLAFACQLIAHLPVEPHDVPVGKIITDEEVLSVGN